ncbi:unnamed protein product [Adineta steineri]|uniref:Uncharacterized protein n=1 Tax=Adineta steineri TaxID=433720 RepID=A0A815CGC9_9BILA|nr:unnamed protein product [Adineta steineri]CAF1287064.1 unnamed protein product [Adineta steineri]
MDSASIDFIAEIYICSTDNEKKEFERIHGFISCTKCYHTSVYRPKSGTKRFIDHANQCSPLASQSTTSPNDPQATQSTLDKIVIKRQINITTKEQNGLRTISKASFPAGIGTFSISQKMLTGPSG